MRFTLLKLLTLFTLIALLAVLLAWPISYYTSRYLPSAPDHGGWRVRSHAGRLGIYRYQPPADGLLALSGAPPFPSASPAPYRGVTIEHDYLFRQFSLIRGCSWGTQTTTRYRGVAASYPVLLFALGIGAAGLLWGYWWQRRQRVRAALGQCVNCGYDLRATPDRCPECGAVTKVVASAGTP